MKARFNLLGMLLFLLIACTVATPLMAQETPYDPELERLEKKLPELSGQAKLDTLVFLVQKTALRYPEKGRYFLKVTEEEAKKEGNSRIQAFAKGKWVEIYAYQLNTDSILAAAAAAEEFCRKHEQYKALFTTQQIVVQWHAFKGEYAEAVRKAKELYNDAKAVNNNLGIATACAAMGNVYFSMKITDEAVRYYKEALVHLKHEPESRILPLNLLSTIINLHYSESMKEEAKLYADTLEMRINECASNNASLDLNTFRFKLEITRANIYLDAEKPQEAYPHIVKAESLAGLRPPEEYELNSTKALYHKHLNEHQAAVKYSEKAIEYLREQEITDLQAFIHYTGHAETLTALNKHKEAIACYDEAAQIIMTNYREDFYSQINQLRTMYELDKLELQAEKNRLQLSITHNKFIAAAIASILLLVIVMIVMHYMQRIRKKNIGLVQRIRQQDLLEEEIAKQQEELDKLRLTHTPQEPGETDKNPIQEEEALIIKMKQLIKENPVYTNATINRKTLAEMLGTNENYLRTAIKEQLGYTFNEYMNELRLNHAKRLLASTSNDTIEEIAAASGFNTRSTLYRKFREKYEVSPDEYRKLIKQV